MPGTNSFYPYGENSTNILNNSEYQTDTERTTGAQPGAIARSKMYNKQARQAAAGAYAVGALVAKSGKNADDSSAAALAANFQAAVNYQAAHFVASDVSVSGTTATATVAELATTAAADLPALFALSLVLDQALPAGANIAIASSLPDVTLSWPIYVGSEVLDSDIITGGAITLLIDTVGAKAFFKAGGMGKLPSDLAPLCPNFKVERNGGKVKISADKIQLNSLTSMVSGGVWAWGKTRPTKPTGENTKLWSRAELITTGKPYDGLYLGDVTPSDAVNVTPLYLPENQNGKTVLAPFVVLSVDYLGGVYVDRLNIITSGPSWFLYQSDVYEGSPHDDWYQETYLNSILDSSVASQIMEVDLPSGAGTIKRKVFGPSYTELYGQAGDGLWPMEGKTMPYFTGSGRLKATNDSGAATGYAMRTTRNSNTQIGFVEANGSITTPTSANGYMRPGFILPKDMKIQQRPDGSYTIWDENGLQTLADVEPSGEVSAVYANITEGGKIVPTIFLNKEYSGTEGALLLRNDIYTNASMSSATYQNSGADNTCTTWATTVVDEPYRAKMLDIEVKYYDVEKASVQTVPSKRKAFILGSQGLNVPGADTWPEYETASPYFTSDNRRKAPSGNVYWNRDKYEGNNAFSAYYNVSSTRSAGYENGANSRGIRPARVLGLDTPVRALADGSYDLVPDDPALSEKQARVPDIPETPPEGTPIQLKDIPVSTAGSKVTVKIPETGGEQIYFTLRKNYDGVSGGYALMRNNTAPGARFHATPDGGDKPYQNSELDTHVQNFANNLNESVRKYLIEGSVLIGVSGSQVTLKRSIFLPSVKEVGYTFSSIYPEGTPFEYFDSNNSRKSDNDYWTRSRTMSSGSGKASYISLSQGGLESASQTSIKPIRPIILVSGEAWFTVNGDGTYTFVGDEPTPTEQPLEIEIDWPEGDPLVARQWVYNQKGVYQTMLLGGIASTEDAPPYDPVLANNTWEMIAQACADNDPILDSWLVGDEKDEVINGETLTFVIVGKNVDDLADGSGKAPLTFGMKNLMAETRKMNATNTNSGSFAGSEMYSRLSDTIYPNLPTELKDAIKAVNKKTASGRDSSAIRTDPMYLWLFSEIEVFGTTTYSYAGEGTQYPYFATAAERIKKLSNGVGAANFWWERSPFHTYSGTFGAVDASGKASGDAASKSYGVCFGFCI